jgi:putative heme-binding domain-containing protein
MNPYYAALVVSLVSLAVGCASVNTEAGVPTDEDAAQRSAENLDGRGLYMAFCVNCHGRRGQGSALGKELTDDQANSMTDDEIIETITKGRFDKGMMKFGDSLSPAEILMTAEYVRELQGRDAQRLARRGASSKARPSARAPHAGAVAAGKALFDGKAGCLLCHSVASEGGTMGPELDGVAGRLDADGLRAALEDPSATIAEGYQTKKAVTNDGRTAEGRVRNETDATIQILSASRTTWLTYFKARLKSLEATPESQMPAPVFTQLSKAEQKSLLNYLSTLQ